MSATYKSSLKHAFHAEDAEDAVSYVMIWIES